MKFQPGDTVSFINEKQQGIVKKILAGNMVVVEIEDGFEFQVRENELVKTGTIQFDHSEQSALQAVPIAKDTGDILDCCPANTAIIAAIPDAAGAVLTGPLTYYLINRSGYDLLFTFYCRHNDTWKGMHRAILKTESSQELAQFRREELIEIQSFLFQGLLFSDSKLRQVSTIRNEFGVLMPVLQNARKELTGMAAFAATVTVFTAWEPEDLPVKELLQKYQGKKLPEPLLKYKTSAQGTAQPEKYGILENEKEVDLHIEELVSDISSLSNAEMLEIQIQHFTKAMDKAIRSHLKKIIFIHGVGNGKLKDEIRKELRHYEGVAFKDADSRKYGQGATEVTIL